MHENDLTRDEDPLLGAADAVRVARLALSAARARLRRDDRRRDELGDALGELEVARAALLRAREHADASRRRPGR